MEGDKQLGALISSTSILRGKSPSTNSARKKIVLREAQETSTEKEQE